MLKNKKNKQHGQSALEFMMLLALIIFAYLALYPWIVRGISGRWKATGDALGSGRLYDPQRTVDCRFDAEFNTETWYNFDCFSQSCDCYFPVAINATELDAYYSRCRDCINRCRIPVCCQSGDITNCSD